MDIKWKISFFSALIFLLIVHPMTYKLTQTLLGDILGKIADVSGCPTNTGLALHTIVYILLVRGSMELNLCK